MLGRTTAGGVFFGNEGCHDATGGVAGGQIGYRWQSAAWVFGLEAQGDWADLRGSNLSLFVARRSPTARASTRSACSPARSATPGITPCSTSRAAARSPTDRFDVATTLARVVVDHQRQ